MATVTTTTITTVASTAPQSSSPLLRIFFTGATGFIGGTVLQHLLHSSAFPPSSTHITALIRAAPANQQAIATLRSHSNVTVLEGSQHDAELVSRAVREADAVVHTANSADDLPALRSILAGLTVRDGRRRLLLHTSGTGEITDDARGQYATPDSEIWTDVDLARWDSIPLSAPHRDVDHLLIDTARQHRDAFDAVIIAPPTIYGRGTGPGNRLSQQIPTLIRGILSTGRGAMIGKGLNRWQSVHVEDLAHLYALLLQAGLQRRISFIADGGGLFFAASGEFAWGDISREVTRCLHERGRLPSAEVAYSWTEQEVEQKLGGKVAWMAIGSNSRCRSERADKEGLGWRPVHIKQVLANVRYDVDAILQQQQ